MSESDALIRPYIHNDEDNKLVRITVAKATMEPLAVANRKGEQGGLRVMGYSSDID